MDTIKTGALIKDLRKEKNMTQKELADLLYVTDRAVSKWERGLCAPDISLLEPLAKALGASILELIEGERAMQTDYMEEIEESAKNVIDYLKSEIAHKVRIAKKKYLSRIAICLMITIAICGFILWRSGYLFIIDRSISPDENHNITVYSKDFAALSNGSFSDSFSMEDAISIIAENKKGGTTRIAYGNCAYQGIWWAPDSKKYVIALKYDDGVLLILDWLEKNSSSNLSAYLSMGVEMTELSKYDYTSKEGWPEIEYQFLQWALDSQSMLIYYSFEDQDNQTHDGYFWYHCELGTVSAVLEMG